jgi:photosystem II stability/assembly factor-like uncharacterized protein
MLFAVGLTAFPLILPGNRDESTETSVDDASEAEDERSKRAEGLRFRRLSLMDENGAIDPNGLRKARQHIEEMKKVQAKRRSEREGEIQEAGIAPDSWTWLGPGNIGGRIRSISINPANANDMLVGSVSGGIWRTLNGGSSWFPVADFMANLAVATIARSPTNTNLLYAGTGEGFGNIDNIQGAGIFVSNDAGASWNQLAATNNANFNFVNRLTLSQNGATLLAATNSGVWRSTDGGANWSQRTFNQSPDIDFHPTDSARAIVGELGFARFSTDGGQSWTAATFSPGIGSGRVELAYAPIGGLIVYASVDNNNGDLYRSTNGGQSFARVNTGTNYMLGANSQGWYDNAVWVNPQDPNFVIVGGVVPYRSFDGGTTLELIGNFGTNLPHADHHVFVSHPGFNNNTNKTVFFGNDGGIQRMADVSIPAPATAGWTELNNNLGITQFYGAAGNAATGVIIGGTQDNGTLRYNGNAETWTSTQGADGGYCAADLTDGNYFYGESQILGVFRSNNAGASATYIVSGLLDNQSGQTNFIAPLVIDPNEPNRLLAGGWSLWRTNDARASATWNAIKNPSANSPISAIAINPNNSDFVVVGHNNGDIYLNLNTTNANPIPNWTKIDTAGLPARMVTRLMWDQYRGPNWIYATFGGFSADNVYVTRDLGASWIDITGSGNTGLPNVPVRSVVFHPSNANLLYVGTEAGIFSSEDAGATWDLPNGGPANVSVDELFWMGGDLIAATHGRGAYRASGGFYVDCNYFGVQTGSFLQPFRTVNAAINAVPVNRYTPIWLKPCNYTEQINTANNPGKRFELRNLGGTTIVGP